MTGQMHFNRLTENAYCEIVDFNHGSLCLFSAIFALQMCHEDDDDDDDNDEKVTINTETAM